MNVSQGVRAVMAMHGVNVAQLARRCGMSRTCLSSRLNRSRSMQVDNLAEMLGAMGYEVAFVPRGATLPRGSIVPDEWGEPAGGEEE